MKKSVFSVVSLFLSLVLLFAACGSVASAGADPVKLTFLDVMPSPDRTALLEGLIARFMEENEGIVIEYTSVPWDQSYQSLVNMGAGGTLPDIITTDQGIMQSLARAGYLVDLEDYYNSLPAKDDFSEATLVNRNAYTMDDHVYTVPDGYLVQGIFVRVDWLKEAGYDVADLGDWTWDEYFKVIEDLTDPAAGRYGISFRGGPNGGLRFYEYLGSMLEIGNAYPNGDHTSIYEDPKALEYFEQFYGLYLDGYAPQDSINWGFQEMVEGFVSGQCGTLNQTPEVTVTCEEAMAPGTWTVLPQPKKAGAAKNSTTWGYTAGYSISDNCENVDAAWKFIEWITSPEINLEYSKGFGCLPLYKSTLNDPFFQEGEMKGYADTFLDPKIQFLSQPSELSEWGYFLAEYSKGETQKYMTGQQDAQTTLDNLATWMRDAYDAEIAGK